MKHFQNLPWIKIIDCCIKVKTWFSELERFFLSINAIYKAVGLRYLTSCLEKYLQLEYSTTNSGVVDQMYRDL